MFQLEKINSLFNCELCQDLIVDPVVLPCGETVCKIHTEDLSQMEKCKFCMDNHKTPRNGFPSNKSLKNLLDLKANRISLNFSKFNDYRTTLADLNTKLKEFEEINNDPENYISEYFGELTRQVDLRRETLIKDIHHHSDELLQNIDRLKEECVANSKKATKIKDSINAIKTKMNILNQTFDTLDMDELKHEEILSQRKSKEVSDLLEPVLKYYKMELQGKKDYKLTSVAIKVENMFGSLIPLDFDIDNLKVNVCDVLYLWFW
jgi:hypothetical protein